MADTTIDMTLKEASTILGVSPGASRDDIQQSYRELIKKYHPDKWRSKPEAERERATQIYQQIVNARKVLTNPSLAKPEQGAPKPYDPFENGTVKVNQGGTRPQQQPQPTQYNGGGVDATSTSRDHRQPRRTHTASDDMWAGVGNGAQQQYHGGGATRTHHTQDQTTQQQRPQQQPLQRPKTGRQRAEEKYNKAKSFEDQFGSLKDNYEDDLANQYRRYANKRYRQKGDAFRRSLSMIVTIAMLGVVLYGVSQNIMPQIQQPATFTEITESASATGYTSMPDTTPYLICLVACVVKFVIWDMLLSYYMKRALHDKNANLDGIPTIIGSVVITAIVAVVMWGTNVAVNALIVGAGGVVLGGLVCATSAARHVDGRDYERL